MATKHYTNTLWNSSWHRMRSRLAPDNQSLLTLLLNEQVADFYATNLLTVRGLNFIIYLAPEQSDVPERVRQVEIPPVRSWPVSQISVYDAIGGQVKYHRNGDTYSPPPTPSTRAPCNPPFFFAQNSPHGGQS